ncbi:hypothetical protein AcdelDRAFT_4052 [Acidovorax delafieldii 2AN]|uniref:Uncharacterized protein n=1 Tax=Acidovorax delafieldii 2AN TaxID=573060 RepID=C5TAX2_ACIDE|nr:hypothetical protein AcdelDRAFT_4052 [Acidovorax delafieldii 2AN]
MNNGITVARKEIFYPWSASSPSRHHRRGARPGQQALIHQHGHRYEDAPLHPQRHLLGPPLDPAGGFGGCEHSDYGWKGGWMPMDGFPYGKAVYLRVD